jgi:hypothetical protein
LIDILKVLTFFRFSSPTIRIGSNLSQRYPLKCLCLHNANRLSEDVFPTALRQFPDLEYLQVTGFKVSSMATVNRLLHNHPKLVLIGHSGKIFCRSTLKAGELAKFWRKWFMHGDFRNVVAVD